LGIALPMFVSFRSFLFGLAGILAVMLTGVWAGPVMAQSSVETYVDSAAPAEMPEGVFPEGVEWNQPLKAGSLTLPKKPKAKAAVSSSRPKPPTLPVGGLKAPQMDSSTPRTPSLASSKSSSANVMLMEGMKSALQKAGQNPNLPPSEAAAPEEDTTPETGTLQQPAAMAETAVPESPSADKTALGLQYEPGREPRSLSFSTTLDGAASPAGAVAASETDAHADVETPKATEIEQPPVPLEQSSAQPPSASEKASKSPSLFDSIFGPSAEAQEEDKAEEKAEEKAETAVAETKEPEAPAEKPCEPSVKSWTKECSEAGYPANYTGKITGETRIECPQGAPQDVWLSNSCAPPVLATEGGPRATDLQEAPKSLADPDAVVEGKADLGAAEAASASRASPGVRVDANCGSANGMAADGKPAADLCAQGEATDVSGDGPWRWSCKGSNGGITVSCAAPVAKSADKPKTAAKTETGTAAKAQVAEDGKCGAADGTGTDTAPTDNLCDKGIASRVNGGGPWTWACSGTNGGQADACSAPRKVDGACGAASGSGVEEMPQRDLCTTGYASAVTGDGPWHWTCSGLYGGAAATCTAAPKVNAVCGAASLKGHQEAPTSELCKTGEASGVEGGGPWTWTCAGAEGGASVTCKAPTMVDGVCGAANGSSFDKAPEEDLCSQGSASRVTGFGPWTWNCAGAEGGTTVGCTAALSAQPASKPAGPVACGSAAESAAFQAPVENLCASGKASAVGGSGPWAWSCSDDEGHNVACSTLAATEGSCGTAANVSIYQAPEDNLCASGAPSVVKKDKKGSNWIWHCRGSMGAATVSCTAPVAQAPAADAKPSEEAKCGAASGRGVAEVPAEGLCDAGKPGTVRGSGPWFWTCAGPSHKVDCEAPKKVDGVCGEANGSIQKSVPLTGLCAAGTPTEIDGDGPWLWSCVGAGGGSSVSCAAASQAQARVDGSCGAAANTVVAAAPDMNLCDSGIPSAVNGEGPWTWTCSGLNGGIASTCTTSKVLPKAPPPPGQPINGNCGPANGVAAVVQPSEGLCSSGTVTAISGSGPWNWNCLGSNGGMTVSCTAPLMPPAPIEGVCGPSNGVSVLTKPKTGLCSAGIASAVSGRGPWTWSCSGTNGGGAVSCVAPLAGKGTPESRLPSMVTPSAASGDEAPAPSAAPVGLVTPKLPEGPLPPLETGTMPQLQPSGPFGAPSEMASASSLGETAGRAVSTERLVLDAETSSFSFRHGSQTIDNELYKPLDKLSIMLLSHPNARVTLVAYAGTTGDISPREARRLSLARALAIRDYLTNKGVKSNRIDVRALGANVPSGDMDRVDVKAD